MESVGQSGSWNFGVFKEPLGFIKVLEFVLSIFAFATTTSHETSTTFTTKCNGTDVHTRFSYGYPYQLEDVCFGIPLCSSDKSDKFCLLAGSKSSAEFYVFVGVIVFLYCLAALVVYIVFDDTYRKNNRIVIADFVISVVLALLWIISSSAWAAGVSNIKMYTDPVDGGIYGSDSKVTDCHKSEDCTTDSLGNFASLNVSVIFGFLNFLVWVGNLWFLYKETPWFKVQAKPPTQPGESPSSGNVY
ncbi:hypothetical protein BsWGS_11582 [Bradybaena similaris]